MLARICAVEKLSIEKLDPDHSKDKLKEDVDNEDVEHVLERDDDTVENRFELWNPVDRFQWSREKCCDGDI